MRTRPRRNCGNGEQGDGFCGKDGDPSKRNLRRLTATGGAPRVRAKGPRPVPPCTRWLPGEPNPTILKRGVLPKIVGGFRGLPRRDEPKHVVPLAGLFRRHSHGVILPTVLKHNK